MNKKNKNELYKLYNNMGTLQSAVPAHVINRANNFIMPDTKKVSVTKLRETIEFISNIFKESELLIESTNNKEIFSSIQELSDMLDYIDLSPKVSESYIVKCIALYDTIMETMLLTISADNCNSVEAITYNINNLKSEKYADCYSPEHLTIINDHT